MNKYAGPEENVPCEPETDRIAHLPTPVGTFSLRRAHYFTKTGMPLLNKEQLTAEQQQALIRLVRKGDVGAKRKMIACNMHLVVDLARRYANCGSMPLDLIREGNHGLAQALEKFEPEGDYSFPAYATRCIRQNIERAIMSRSYFPTTSIASMHHVIEGGASAEIAGMGSAMTLTRANANTGACAPA